MHSQRWVCRGLSFLGSWIVATAAGSLLALLGAQVLLTSLKTVMRITADEILVGAMLGLILGAAQWWVLRRHLRRSSLWVSASLFGGLAVGVVATQAGDAAGSIAAFTFYGIVLATFQWTILLHPLQGSGLWVPASGAAWGLGLPAFAWIDRIALTPTWPFGELWTVAIMYALLGVITGSVTGIVMAWILQNAQTSSRSPIAETVG
jgi:hypothetical protein